MHRGILQRPQACDFSGQHQNLREKAEEKVGEKDRGQGRKQSINHPEGFTEKGGCKKDQGEKTRGEKDSG